ncbi:hypothetical protein H9P43_007656 [Blastocladiella emersonii ATCC 22665]|nr:hypothetical protein H9P43_007656 [Blastocladiella emersonii ATCC 22665]
MTGTTYYQPHESQIDEEMRQELWDRIDAFPDEILLAMVENLDEIMPALMTAAHAHGNPNSKKGKKAKKQQEEALADRPSSEQVDQVLVDLWQFAEGIQAAIDAEEGREEGDEEEAEEDEEAEEEEDEWSDCEDEEYEDGDEDEEEDADEYEDDEEEEEEEDSREDEYYTYGQDLDQCYELARQLQMPLVWFLKLRFPGALRNDTPGLRGGDDPAAVAARTGHPFSPSVAAYFYRKNQFVPDSIVDAIAPFTDLPMGTDLLHGSFAFRAVPEGLSLIHFFLHVGGLDAMLVCLNHLLTIFPASLRTDRAKITTWSRFWLSERSITRENISLMDEDDPSVDTSYPVTFPMALALAAMTVWNRAAIERLLDGDYGVDRTELFAWFSREETSNVFLCTLYQRYRAAEIVPPILDWLVGEGWVRGRERHASMSYYAWDHADYALFKVLFERYDLPLLDEMDAETRFDVGAGLAPFLDEGHHDQIPRFAELGLINNDSWTRILASALDTPKVLEPVLGYLETYVERSDLLEVLSNACSSEYSSWPPLSRAKFLALINACGVLGFEPAQVVEPHLTYYANEPDLAPLFLSPAIPGLDPCHVLKRVIKSLALFDSNCERSAPFLTEVCARTADPDPAISLSMLFKHFDLSGLQTMLIIQLVKHILELLTPSRATEDAQISANGEVKADNGQRASVLLDVLDQLMERYPYGFGPYNLQTTTSLRSALCEHYNVDFLASADFAQVAAASDPHHTAGHFDACLFIKLVGYDVEFMTQIVKDVRGFDIPWVLKLLCKQVRHPSDLAAALSQTSAEDMIRRAILNGQYDHACRLMRVSPPSKAFGESLANMVKAKELREAQTKVLDVFGIEAA